MRVDSPSSPLQQAYADGCAELGFLLPPYDGDVDAGATHASFMCKAAGCTVRHCKNPAPEVAYGPVQLSLGFLLGALSAFTGVCPAIRTVASWLSHLDVLREALASQDFVNTLTSLTPSVASIFISTLAIPSPNSYTGTPILPCLISDPPSGSSHPRTRALLAALIDGGAFEADIEAGVRALLTLLTTDRGPRSGWLSPLTPLLVHKALDLGALPGEVEVVFHALRGDVEQLLSVLCRVTGTNTSEQAVATQLRVEDAVSGEVYDGQESGSGTDLVGGVSASVVPLWCTRALRLLIDSVWLGRFRVLEDKSPVFDDETATRAVVKVLVEYGGNVGYLLSEAALRPGGGGGGSSVAPPLWMWDAKVLRMFSDELAARGVAASSAEVHLAAQFGSAEWMEALSLREGFDPNCELRGTPALWSAVLSSDEAVEVGGRDAVTQRLLSLGAVAVESPHRRGPAAKSRGSVSSASYEHDGCRRSSRSSSHALLDDALLVSPAVSEGSLHRVHFHPPQTLLCAALERGLVAAAAALRKGGAKCGPPSMVDAAICKWIETSRLTPRSVESEDVLLAEVLKGYSFEASPCHCVDLAVGKRLSRLVEVLGECGAVPFSFECFAGSHRLNTLARFALRSWKLKGGSLMGKWVGRSSGRSAVQRLLKKAAVVTSFDAHSEGGWMDRLCGEDRNALLLDEDALDLCRRAIGAAVACDDVTGAAKLLGCIFAFCGCLRWLRELNERLGEDRVALGHDRLQLFHAARGGCVNVLRYYMTAPLSATPVTADFFVTNYGRQRWTTDGLSLPAFGTRTSVGSITPLEVALEGGHIEVAEILVRDFRARMDGEWGIHIVPLAVRCGVAVPVLRALIARGADPKGQWGAHTAASLLKDAIRTRWVIDTLAVLELSDAGEGTHAPSDGDSVGGDSERASDATVPLVPADAGAIDTPSHAPPSALHPQGMADGSDGSDVDDGP